MKSDAEKCLDKIEIELSAGRITEEEAKAFREEVEAKAEQKRKLLEDYKAGKIDEIGLNQWQVAISDDFEQLAERIDHAVIHKSRNAAKAKKIKHLWVAFMVFVVLLCIFGVPMYNSWQHSHRNIAGIPEPVQVDIDDAIAAGRVRDVHKKISGKGFSVEMTYLAEYTIQGLVVTLDDYDSAGASAFDLAIPRDISMAWGKAAEYATDIKWAHAARSLSYEYSWSTLQKIGVSSRELGMMSSNNHVIVEGDEIYKALKQVKIGDYIEMKGYLVKADIYDGAGQLVRSIHSSLVRDDHVEYAFDTRTSCEVLFLTDLRWLD